MRELSRLKEAIGVGTASCCWYCLYFPGNLSFVAATFQNFFGIKIMAAHALFFAISLTSRAVCFSGHEEGLLFDPQ